MEDRYGELAPQVSTVMRALQALRRRVEVTCSICGTAFEATPRRMYCSPACKQKAVRERQRAQKAADDKGVG
jgi:endogenous inhibitor of DNA gyrase (YacG/DUF329 family)